MATRATRNATDRPAGEAEVAVNAVTLVGRVSVDPESRELPSGDTLWSVRVIVDRQGPARQRQSVDVIDCTAWQPRLQRVVAGWRAGDRVQVEGALRRRFSRAGGSVVSRMDVEVVRARLIRRAAT